MSSLGCCLSAALQQDTGCRMQDTGCQATAKQSGSRSQNLSREKTRGGPVFIDGLMIAGGVGATEWERVPFTFVQSLISTDCLYTFCA